MSVGITRVVLLFRKGSDNYFSFILHMKWLLKVQLIFLFLVDEQDSLEEVLVLLHKLLGEVQFPLLKKYIVPAAKKSEQVYLKIAAPKIGEVVSGRKQLKTFAKNVRTKAVRKQLGGGKKKSKCRTRRTISRKSSSKIRRSCKEIFDKIK